MKNRFLKLFMITALTVSMIVGCGGNEEGANNGSGVNTNTAANVNTEKDNKTDVSSNPEIDLSLYTEFESGYGITDEMNYGDALVDGEELQNFNWEYVNKYIELTDKVDYYSHEKYYTGFLKSGIEMIYSQTNGKWSTVLINIGDVTGLVFVKTTELTEVMKEIGDYTPSTDESEAAGMSDKAKAYFDRIRNSITEDNKTREEAQKQYPNMTILLMEEVSSPEGLECMGTFIHSFESEVDYEAIATAIRSMNYNKYYIEYIGETDDTVEFKFYGAQ